MFFVSFVATAVAFGAAMAHALEWPNKMKLTREAYFTVQQIYAGWDQLAYVLAVQLMGLVVLLYLKRGNYVARRRLLIALAGFACAQAVFWAYTFPANQLTANWTLQPENWEQLRVQWEYSHLAGAMFQLAALLFLTSAWVSQARGASV